MTTYNSTERHPIVITGAYIKARNHIQLIIAALLLMVFVNPLVADEVDTGADEKQSQKAQTTSSLPEGISNSPLLNSRFLLFGSKVRRSQALRWVKRRDNTDMVAPLIYSLRYLPPHLRGEVVTTLRKLTGTNIGDNWFKWMQWQQARPEIKPFPEFDVYLSALFGSLDEDFKDFIYPGMKHTIRLEEIVWGGVQARDGIPPIDYPKFIDADKADYLGDDEFVFGVNINGDIRAYPYRIMDWHEMLNDKVGGEPVSLAYCTLCGSGILFHTKHPEQEDAHIEFGSSGLLYQSNKLMFDRDTNSLWNQFTGEPVVGVLGTPELAQQYTLSTLPLVTTTWGEWRTQYPKSQVLDPNTGFERDYRPGQPYGKYFKSPTLMFPTLTNDRQLNQKEQVFGLRLSGANRAWPLKDFKGGSVINDKIGVLNVVLIGDAKTRSVRAYRRDHHNFTKIPNNTTSRQKPKLNVILSNDHKWQVYETHLAGPNGEKLTRLPGHLAYWFAWHNYLGGDTLSKQD